VVRTAATPTYSAALSRPKKEVCSRVTDMVRSTTAWDRTRTRSACSRCSRKARTVAVPPIMSSSCCCWAPPTVRCSA
jgi:hypothetical protein